MSFTSFAEVLAAAAQTKHGYTFVDVRETETFISFRDVHARAQRMAGALAERGVRPGDRVAIVLPTSESFLDAFFGAWLAGAVPVPLYPPVRLGRMDEYHRSTARMLRASGARIVLTDARVQLLLGTAVAEARPELGLHRASELLDASPGAREVQVTAEHLALVQFSSGSTTDPKPVALTHRNLLAQCGALKTLLAQGEGRQQVGVSWLPLYHDMGLIGCLLTAPFYPGPLVLIPPELFLARPAMWLRAISRHRGTVSAAPNFAYGLCLKRVRDEDLRGVDLSSWAFALNGAEPVSPGVMDRFAERFGKFGFDRASMMPVYGLSEASLAVTFSPRRRELVETRVGAGDRRIVSVGQPVPGMEVQIRDDAGAEVAEGTVGRIHVRGASVMHGYLDAPEATSRVLKDGWLDTGDLGFLRDGELFVCGRSRDLVIVRGANHAPQEFEECLEAVPGVRTGCAVALGFVPEDSGSEELLILAERSDDATEDDEAIAQRARAAIVERTGIRPHTIRIVPPGTLPRTSSGKLRRAEALRRFLAGELSAPEKVTGLTVAREVARSTAATLWSRLTTP